MNECRHPVIGSGQSAARKPAALQQQEVTPHAWRGDGEKSSLQHLHTSPPRAQTEAPKEEKGGAPRDFFFLPPRQTRAMPLKNTVAVERRVDLASLFCMIGRHGPAVALAVVAVVSVLAGLVIYRTVRGKRRKAAAAAAAAVAANADGGAEGDVPVIRESTDVNDEGSSDVKEDVDLIPSDLRVRHRRAAAEQTSAPYRPAENDVRAPGVDHAASYGMEGDSRCADFHRSYSRDPKPTNSDKPKQRKEVSTTESQDAEGGTTEKDVIDETPRQEDNFQPLGVSGWNEDGGLDGDEDHLDKRSAVKLDATSTQFNEHVFEIEQKGGDSLVCDDKVGVLYNGANQAEDKMLSGGSNIACKEEQDGLSVAVSSAPNGLSSPITADNHDGGLSGSSVLAECADLSLDCQPQKDNTTPSLDEDENQPECVRNGPAVTDQVNYPHVQSSYQDQQSIQTERVQDADTDTAVNEPLAITENLCSPHLKAIHEDKPIGVVEKETVLDSAAAGDKTSCTALVMSEVSDPDPQSFPLDPQGDQAKNYSDDFTSAPDMHPHFCQVDAPSFEQFELRDIDMSYAAVGKESGISSLAVSPDAFNEYDVMVENMMVSAGQTEAQYGLYADDAAVEEDTAAMVLRPDSSHCYQPAISECEASTLNESFLSEEDMFGRDIEESYCSAIDQFAAQIADSVTCFAKKPPGLKAAVQSEEKIAGGNVKMKVAIKGDEEDYEKTEISIMEATMDHNEWIMDNNYQAFPWMTPNVPSSAHDDTKTYQLPSEGFQFTSAVVDTTCTDASDIPPAAKVQPAGTLSLVDQHAENIRNVVAVQNVDVTFSIHYITQSPNQTVAVTGDRWELGNWKGFVPLQGVEDGHWATVVRLPSESHVEWKFVVVEKGQVCRWEECGNRLLDTGCRDRLLVHECWARL
ncbi:uncharacterized protein stbd1 [Pungitius pungitius]|uniref:uncharacterized protein stbd1 n=1 Tax=Pungitius pungitius TaxID=134920 RepID=UPI002E0E0511